MEIRPVSDLRNKFSEIEKKLKKENQYISYVYLSFSLFCWITAICTLLSTISLNISIYDISVCIQKIF